MSCGVSFELRSMLDQWRGQDLNRGYIRPHRWRDRIVCIGKHNRRDHRTGRCSANRPYRLFNGSVRSARTCRKTMVWPVSAWKARLNWRGERCATCARSSTPSRLVRLRPCRGAARPLPQGAGRRGPYLHRRRTRVDLSRQRRWHRSRARADRRGSRTGGRAHGSAQACAAPSARRRPVAVFLPPRTGTEIRPYSDRAHLCSARTLPRTRHRQCLRPSSATVEE